MKNTKRVDVQVTKEDIHEGTCGDANTCMMARAIGRHIKDGLRVQVYNRDGAILSKAGQDADRVTRFALSRAARAAIKKFDTKRSSVKPTTFRITLPMSVLR